MPASPLPPKIKFATGLLVMFGVLVLLACGADAWLAPAVGPKSGFQTDRGYDEGNGSDGYHVRFFVSGTGTGALRTVRRCAAALAGIGFLFFGVRLFTGSAQTLVPAATLAAVIGLGAGYVGAQLASHGQATVGLPGMGLAFVLLVAACLLVAGRGEYRAWRSSHAVPRRAVTGAALWAGVLLVAYGFAVVGFAGYRAVSWLKSVRGQPEALGLRAEASASTSIEALGTVLKSSAEKCSSFSPGPGFFLHPQAVAVAWGGVWAATGLALLLGRGPSSRFVGLVAVMAATAVTALAVLFLFSNLPWYAAMPDGLFPGCLAVLAAGVLLVVARDASANRDEPASVLRV